MENIDNRVNHSKEQGHTEKGAKEPTRQATAAISQAAAWAAKNGKKS